MLLFLEIEKYRCSHGCIMMSKFLLFSLPLISKFLSLAEEHRNTKSFEKTIWLFFYFWPGIQSVLNRVGHVGHSPGSNSWVKLVGQTRGIWEFAGNLRLHRIIFLRYIKQKIYYDFLWSIVISQLKKILFLQISKTEFLLESKLWNL